MRKSTLIIFSILYWLAALLLAGLATAAPCGFAPGVWCEEQGPNWLGATLASLGPLGVLLVASAIYAGAIWLGRRHLKDG